MSILLALGVRAWQDSHQVTKLITRSLTSFQNEITQNRRQIDDLYRYHAGLQSLLDVDVHSGEGSSEDSDDHSGEESSDDADVHSSQASSEDVDYILDSLHSAVLLTSAWNTALATGALADMEYETVFVLSLTYSYQEKFQTLYDSRLEDVLELTTDDKVSAKRRSDSAKRYLAEITSAEGDLLAAYDQAIVLLSNDAGEFATGTGTAQAASLP